MPKLTIEIVVFAAIGGFLLFLYLAGLLSDLQQRKSRASKAQSQLQTQSVASRKASKRQQFSQLAEERRHLPAIVYVVQKGDIHKVGISSTAAKTDRVREHELNGWVLRQQWTVPTYDEARTIELKVLRFWRKQLQLRPVKIDMPQGGQTETADLYRCGYESTRVLLVREVSRAQRRRQSANSTSTQPTPRDNRKQPSNRAEVQKAQTAHTSNDDAICGRFVKLNHLHSAQIRVGGKEVTLESKQPITVAGPEIEIAAIGVRISATHFRATKVIFNFGKDANPIPSIREMAE